MCIPVSLVRAQFFCSLSLYSRFVWAFHFEREQQKEWESMCCCSFFSTSGWLFSTISSKGPLTHLLTRTFSSKEWFLFNFHFVLLLLFELKLKLLYGKHMGHICPSTHLCRTLSIQRILHIWTRQNQKPDNYDSWHRSLLCNFDCSDITEINNGQKELFLFTNDIDYSWSWKFHWCSVEKRKNIKFQGIFEKPWELTKFQTTNSIVLIFHWLESKVKTLL